MKAEKIIRLRMQNSIFCRRIPVVQGDRARTFRFILEDITLDGTEHARIYARKPSGAEIYDECDVIGSNEVIFTPETEQIFIETGIIQAEIRVAKGEKLITSYSFEFEVRQSTMRTGDIPSSDEFNVLERAIEEAKGLHEPEFTEAGKRENIVSGETMQILFGKIKKWFTDLGALITKIGNKDISSIGDGTVTGAITDLDKRSTKNTSDIDVERKRIDNIAKLPEGSTAGDAELADIRVAADGTVYDTAGESVRGQINQIDQKYEKETGSLKEDIGLYNSIYSGSKYFKRIDESIQWNQNKYWNTETNEQMDGDGFAYGKLQCNAGDIFQVTSTGTKISNAVAFIDDSGNILQKSGETTDTTYTSKQFEAPAFTKFVIFNGVTALDNRLPLILMSYEIDFVPEFANKISKNSGMIENISSIMEWNNLPLKKVANSYFEGWDRGFITGAPGFEYTLIQAKAGDKFKYSGISGKGYRAASFRDKDGRILGSTSETEDTTYIDLILTAPYGTYDIVFNAASASNMQISKLETPKIFKEIPLKKSSKLFMEDKYVDYPNTGFESAEVDAKQGDTFIYVNGYSEPNWRAIYFVDKDYNVLDKSNETDSSIRKNIIMTAPYGTAKAIFNNNLATQNELIIRKKTTCIDNKSFWKDKKIAWFGTSIPAGTQEWNYPYEVGELQGSIVYNEAVGSSCARAGCKSKITSTDPYGWTGANFYNVAYGLSGTLSEKNELINNFSKWKTLLEGCPDTLSDSEKQKILGCSYEKKLDKYLSNGSVGTVDLYVFDHGYNDNWFYNSSINQMDVIPDNNMDRFYYIGAMNFLINRILEDNPKAVICFIGHYEADREETSIVTKAQQVLADYWRFPFIKTWKCLPFTERTVQANGYWQMSGGIGTWVQDDKQHLMTMREVWLADGLHPYSDGSGKATFKYANLLANFLNENVN